MCNYKARITGKTYTRASRIYWREREINSYLKEFMFEGKLVLPDGTIEVVEPVVLARVLISARETYAYSVPDGQEMFPVSFHDYWRHRDGTYIDFNQHFCALHTFDAVRTKMGEMFNSYADAELGRRFEY